MPRAKKTHPYRKTQILTANPGELMLLLYNAAITSADQACVALKTGRYEDAHALLVRAENCVMELSAGLRRDVYPELVENLARLFEYVFYKFFEGNVSHNAEHVADGLNVLKMLRDAWGEAVAQMNEETGESTEPGQPGSMELSA